MSIEERQMLLREAEATVTQDRGSSQTEAEDNFSAIASIWNALGVRVDGRPLKAHDVSMLMIGLKLARVRHNPEHRDSWVDIAGYSACGWSSASPHKSLDERVRDDGDTILSLIDKINHRIAEEGLNGKDKPQASG